MEDKGLRRQVNLTCALYAALSVACLAVLQSFSWAPVQVRLSESLCVVALFLRGAAPRLATRCAAAKALFGFVLANALGWPLSRFLKRKLERG